MACSISPPNAWPRSCSNAPSNTSCGRISLSSTATRPASSRRDCRPPFPRCSGHSATSATSSISFLTGEGAAVLAIWVGGRLIVNGRLTSGALISFILYAFLVARGFRNASDFWNEAVRSVGATEWIFALLERSPGLRLEGGETPRLVGHLTFERVRFVYPTR